jgi:hypothetical protein
LIPAAVQSKLAAASLITSSISRNFRADYKATPALRGEKISGATHPRDSLVRAAKNIPGSHL